MSRYEWEAGTIVLPAAEACRVKKAVKAAASSHGQRLYDAAQEFWRAMPRRYRAKRDLYERAAGAYVHGNNGYLGEELTDLPRWRGVRDADDGFRDDLHEALLRAADPRPRRVRRSDVPAAPTGASPSFACGESMLRFDGRKAHWRVPENNHARDRGRSHPVARAFFAELRRVRWTRGSGGEIVGNDEYNRDSEYEGGGGNYVVDSYGPRARRW